MRAWFAGANPGERFEYHRGLLATDRYKGTSSLKEPERRRLAAVADHALVLADRGELHLLQERHGNSDYSYFAVKASGRALARSVGAGTPSYAPSRRPSTGADHPATVKETSQCL